MILSPVTRSARAVDQRDGVANIFQAWITAKGFELYGEFGNDFLESLGIEDAYRFRERTERSPRTAEFFLDVLEFAGLLQATERLDDGVEEEEQDQHAILIVVQRAITGGISLTADIVEAFEQRSKLIEVL